jgi:hypothetical protein
LRVLFERKLADGMGMSCEGGPLGSLMVPLTWTDRGPAGARTPLTYEVVVELAEVVAAVKGDTGGDVVDLPGASADHLVR